MNLAVWVLGAMIASLIGAAFHLILGGSAGRLVLFLVLAWAGFAAGQLLASWLGWEAGSLGPLHVGVAALGSAIFLAIGYWLSLVKVDKK